MFLNRWRHNEFLIFIFCSTNLSNLYVMLLSSFCLPACPIPGIFILNLVCRNLALRESVLEHVSAMFPTILSKKIEEDVNEVLLCSCEEKTTSEAACSPPLLNQAAKSLQNKLRFDGRRTTSSSPQIDIAESLKNLTLL